MLSPGINSRSSAPESGPGYVRGVMAWFRTRAKVRVRLRAMVRVMSRASQRHGQATITLRDLLVLLGPSRCCVLHLLDTSHPRPVQHRKLHVRRASRGGGLDCHVEASHAHSHVRHVTYTYQARRASSSGRPSRRCATYYPFCASSTSATLCGACLRARRAWCLHA